MSDTTIIRGILATSSNAVSNTALRALAASWSSAAASANSKARSGVLITNHSTTLYAYALLVAKDASVSGVSATANNFHIGPRQTVTIMVDHNSDIAIVRDSSSTDACTVSEFTT